MSEDPTCIDKRFNLTESQRAGQAVRRQQRASPTSLSDLPAQQTRLFCDKKIPLELGKEYLARLIANGLGDVARANCIGEFVDELVVFVPEATSVLRRGGCRERAAELEADLHLLLLGRGAKHDVFPGVSPRGLLVRLHRVTGQLLHEDASVSLGKLAHEQPLNVPKAAVVAEGVGADLADELVEQRDRRLDALDLGDCDRLDEVQVGDGAGAQDLAKASFHSGSVPREGVELLLALAENRGDVRDFAELGRGLALGGPADLVVRVRLGLGEQGLAKVARGLRDGEAASEESLAKDLNAHAVLGGLDVLVVLDVSKATEKGFAANGEVVKVDAGIVQVVGSGLHAHVLDGNAGVQLASLRVANLHDETVRAVKLAVDAQVGNHHGVGRG
mmetsp:Transcript_11127/g.35460  ORF Transcript_11127/g.35460 Transcript_11127/m.35460 type:complete len:389 (+) Transcript_11127:257-1423(+)